MVGERCRRPEKSVAPCFIGPIEFKSLTEVSDMMSVCSIVAWVEVNKGVWIVPVVVYFMGS